MPLSNSSKEAWTRIEMIIVKNEQILGFVLKTESIGLPYRLNVGSERKRIKERAKALA